jgi:hypothetical protein
MLGYADRKALKNVLDASARNNHVSEGERMQTLKRAAVLAAAAMAMGAAPVLAQTVTFSTTGQFTGGGATCNGSASCVFGGYTLSYTGAPSVSYGAPTLVDLGSFTATCTAVPCGTNVSVPVGATFTLTITQTQPSGAPQSFTGSVAGAFTWDPVSSSMKWTPTTSTLTIAGVLYTLVTDNTGNINIVAPSSNVNPNTTLVKANIVASPEPSTVALMATGIFGLVPLIRRRRK